MDLKPSYLSIKFALKAVSFVMKFVLNYVGMYYVQLCITLINIRFSQ